MPVVSRILECYLWVKDAERAAEFYKDLFGFEVIGRSSELASTITSVLALRSFGCRFTGQ
jgi:catechol 2,3-dioxygenase-like lactoylglutathione lyase family enzyme